MAQILDIDALDALIKAVQDYQVKLDTNRQILANAANVCDQAMGSDAIAKKHIGRLNEALEELKKTSKTAAEVAEQLIEDRRRAMMVLEEN